MRTPVSANEKFEIAVFRKGSSTRCMAYERIPKEEARYMVDARVARWVDNRYISIIMLIEATPSQLRDQSCQMGPRVIEAVADGKSWAVGLLSGWAPAKIDLGRSDLQTTT